MALVCTRRPVGWLVHRDVQAARERLNFSEEPIASKNQREEIYDVLTDESMPPRRYLLLHPEARLSKDDVTVLESWSDR